jgi:cyclopropane fatty-acyl-phospholipid synthase-like methyltransferase
MVLMQMFFPGTVLASYEYQMDECRKAGFQVTHDSEHDYRATLKAWYSNLVEHKEKAIKLVGVSTYNKYLVFFPMSWKVFDEGQAIVHRLVLEKPT